MAEGAKFTKGGGAPGENRGGGGNRGTIGIPEAMERLRRAGIDVPAFAVARTPEEAGKAADSIGYPVVLKILSDQVVHKTDAGGVATGISSAEEARSACERMLLEVPRRYPGRSCTASSCRHSAPPASRSSWGERQTQPSARSSSAGWAGSWSNS